MINHEYKTRIKTNPTITKAQHRISLRCMSIIKTDTIVLTSVSIDTVPQTSDKQTSTYIFITILATFLAYTSIY